MWGWRTAKTCRPYFFQMVGTFMVQERWDLSVYRQLWFVLIPVRFAYAYAVGRNANTIHINQLTAILNGL